MIGSSKIFSIWLMLFCVNSVNVVADEIHRVVTPMGTVRGKEFFSGRQNKKFFAFTGIPYAKPPVDGLRFMVSI